MTHRWSILPNFKRSQDRYVLLTILWLLTIALIIAPASLRAQQLRVELDPRCWSTRPTWATRRG